MEDVNAVPVCSFLHGLRGEILAHPLHEGFPAPEAVIIDGVRYERKTDVDYLEVED